MLFTSPLYLPYSNSPKSSCLGFSYLNVALMVVSNSPLKLANLFNSNSINQHITYYLLQGYKSETQRSYPVLMITHTLPDVQHPVTPPSPPARQNQRGRETLSDSSSEEAN